METKHPRKVPIKNTLTKDNIKADITLFMTLAYGQERKQLESVVEYFGGKTTEEVSNQIQKMAQKLVEGTIRAKARFKTYHEIDNDLIPFGQHIQLELSKDLEKSGLEVLNFKIVKIENEKTQ